jgi:hypothetical protein
MRHLPKIFSHGSFYCRQSVSANLSKTRSIFTDFDTKLLLPTKRTYAFDWVHIRFERTACILK